MLPHCLAIGVPYNTFWHLTPKKIKAFEKAYELQRKIEDEKAYMQGIYTLKALEVALSHLASGFSKQKSNAKYFEEPLLSCKNNNGELSEEEKQRQREAFVAMLETMKTNFELNHKKKEK